LTKTDGVGWITALKAPQIKKLVAQGTLRLSLFDQHNLAEITAPEDYPGERLVVCRNPLVAAERRVAYEFLDTAVARKQLERAWSIVTPELKQGMSLDEWKTGTIPVVPYPVAEAKVVLRVVDSFTDTARLRVTFLPRPGAKAQSASFSLDLRNVGGRWLVSSWQPSSVIGPPAGK